VFAAMWEAKSEDEHLADVIIEQKDLKQISDTGALEAIVDEVLAANAKSVEQYRAGKEAAINALIGQTMKASKGKANPAAGVTELLKKKLAETANTPVGEPAVSTALDVFADAALAALIVHDPLDDSWALSYTDAWTRNPQSFPFSPPLPLHPPGPGQDSRSVKRFIEHLLPEGHALDVAVASNGLAKSNVFGLIRALGAETAGVLRFRDGQAGMAEAAHTMREIPLAELNARIADRGVPFTVWDGKVRMSVAGVQDKLLVYLDAPLDQGGRLFLVDGPRLASTHILKPDLGQARLPHLALNEYFCMTLAQRIGLPVAAVELLRAPHPVLVVRRFDRIVQGSGDAARVDRLHMVDACQAADLPVSYKYERNLGNGAEVRHVRDGMRFELLFGLADLTANKALAKLAMLRWALFQFLIGNSDAHGKNFCAFVARLAAFIERQAKRLSTTAQDAVNVPADLL
jgi:serine/threonine-protein kinase HipA